MVCLGCIVRPHPYYTHTLKILLFDESKFVNGLQKNQSSSASRLRINSLVSQAFEPLLLSINLPTHQTLHK